MAIIVRNDVEIELDIIQRARQKILLEEEANCRTKEYDDAGMIKRDMKILEDEVNAYKEN